MIWVARADSLGKAKGDEVKGRLGILFAIAFFYAAALAGSIPGSGANRIYLFASPNQRESLTDEEAKAQLKSFEQVNAAAVADRAACSLSRSVEITDSLGIYEASSENSFILESDLERKQSEYLAALLGLYSRQEFVLLFLDDPSGNDRLWIIKTQQSLGAAVAALRKLQLTPVTLRIEKNGNEVWFVDFGEKHADLLKRFSSDVNGKSTLTAGVAELLGNQSRATAIEGWQQQISASEQQSGNHLSGQLSSKGWREAAAVHTCSKEMSIP